MAKNTASDLSKNIVLEGVPVAYCLSVTTLTSSTVSIASADPSAAIPTAPVYRMLFDTLQSVQYKLIRAAASSGTTAATLEIQLANNGKVIFDKDEVSIDGVTEGIRSASATTSGGTGLGQVILTTTGGDIDSLTYAAYENLVNDSETTTFLLAFPNGFTYDSKGAGKPDGWVFMLGKRSSDYDKTQANANGTIAITFDSVALDSAQLADFKTKFAALSAGSGIKVVGSFTTSGHGTAINVLPPFGNATLLTSAILDKIAAGKVVIVPAP